MYVPVKKECTEYIYVSPCIKCGNDEVSLFDCGYSHRNMGGGRCPSCGNEVSVLCAIFPQPEALAAAWNKRNDVTALLTDKRAKIAELSAEVERLIAIQTKRTKGGDGEQG